MCVCAVCVYIYIYVIISTYVYDMYTSGPPLARVQDRTPPSSGPNLRAQGVFAFQAEYGCVLGKGSCAKLLELDLAVAPSLQRGEVPAITTGDLRTVPHNFVRILYRHIHPIGQRKHQK